MEDNEGSFSCKFEFPAIKHKVFLPQRAWSTKNPYLDVCLPSQVGGQTLEIGLSQLSVSAGVEASGQKTEPAEQVSGAPADRRPFNHITSAD